MLAKLSAIAVHLAADPMIRALVAALALDAVMRLQSKLRALAKTNHRVAWFLDSLPSLIALAKAVIGAQHPDVQRVLDAASARAANLRAVK